MQGIFSVNARDAQFNGVVGAMFIHTFYINGFCKFFMTCFISLCSLCSFSRLHKVAERVVYCKFVVRGKLVKWITTHYLEGFHLFNATHAYNIYGIAYNYIYLYIYIWTLGSAIATTR